MYLSDVYYTILRKGKKHCTIHSRRVCGEKNGIDKIRLTVLYYSNIHFCFASLHPRGGARDPSHPTRRRRIKERRRRRKKQHLSQLVKKIYVSRYLC